MTYFEQAHAAGDAHATFHLGIIHLDGQTVARTGGRWRWKSSGAETAPNVESLESAAGLDVASFWRPGNFGELSGPA